MTYSYDGPCGSRRRRRHRARKERVLHTRVSENLAEDIRRIADDLRVPTSNLVRNVLEEVFDVVETVSDDVGQLVDDIFQEADAARDRLSRRRGRRVDGSERAARGARAEGDEGERAGDPPPPPPVEWHVVDRGRAVGPRDHAWLRREALAGRVGRDTLVWCAGLGDWQPAGEVPGLRDLFAPPPVPGAPASEGESEGEGGGRPSSG